MSLIFSKYVNKLPSDTTWINYLIDSLNDGIKNGLKIYVIAVARKMARLVESYREQHDTLDSILKSTNVELITEHAIPFCLRNANPENSDIIILDDLIVLGDTVDTISEQVYALTGIRPKIIAMAASDKAVTISPYGERIFPRHFGKEESESLEAREFREYILSDDLIPAFTSRNSDRILSLMKPIDLEFTILEAKRKNCEISIRDYVDKILEPNVRKSFPNDVVYRIEHKLSGGKKETINLTVLLSKSIHKLSNNDFSKLRFFVSPDTLRVVCYTPHIWDEIALRKRLFGSDSLQECWESVNSYLRQPVDSSVLDGPEYIKYILLNKYEQRKELSKIVMANYFKSFENVMMLKNKIREAVAESAEGSLDDSLCRNDLKWLVGEALSAQLFFRLKEILREPQFNSSEIIIDSWVDIPPTSLIPSDGIEEYNRKVNFYINYSGNVPVALSLVFTTLWEMFGMINNSKREDRIAVGETFESLEQRIGVYFKSNRTGVAEIKKEVHRWIDSRIDLGVVVPKYESSLNRLGERTWRRYFRAGEREDSMVDVARAFYLLTENGWEKSRLSLIEFIEHLVPLFNELNSATGYQMSLQDFDGGLLRMGLDRTYMSNLWVYLVLIDTYMLLDLKTWQVVELHVGEGGKPTFTTTSLYAS